MARHRFSPKKNGRICFVCFFTLQGKQIKFIPSFFGRIYSAPICFSKLTNLYHSKAEWNQRRFYIASQRQVRQPKPSKMYSIFTTKMSNRYSKIVVTLVSKTETLLPVLSTHTHEKWYFVAKIVLTYCEKKMFLWSGKTFEIRGWRQFFLCFWGHFF